MGAEGIILAKSLIPNLLRACAIVQWAPIELFWTAKNEMWCADLYILAKSHPHQSSRWEREAKEKGRRFHSQPKYFAWPKYLRRLVHTCSLAGFCMAQSRQSFKQNRNLSDDALVKYYIPHQNSVKTQLYVLCIRVSWRSQTLDFYGLEAK